MSLTKMTVLSMVLLGAFITTPVQAATVTEHDITQQETVVRSEATETLQAYLRLVLYALVQKLEARVADA